MQEIRFWRAVMMLFIIGLILTFLFHVFSVIIPFFIGIVIAYLVHPLVDKFTALGWRRDVVVIVLYLILLVSAVVSISILWPKLYSEANIAMQEAPSYAKALDSLMESINQKISALTAKLFGGHGMNFSIPMKASQFLEDMFYKLPSKIIGMAHAGIWIILIPFVSFFALSHGKKWIDGIFALTPSEHVEGLLGIFAELNATLGAYVRGILLESMCVGFITMIGLAAMGVEGAVLIGLVTGCVNFIPFMAPWIGGGAGIKCGVLSKLATVDFYWNWNFNYFRAHGRRFYFNSICCGR